MPGCTAHTQSDTQRRHPPRRSIEPGFGPDAEPRPVVRVLDAAARTLTKVFTRVQPGSTSTSIMLRVRDGWEQLRRALVPDPHAAPPGIGPKQK